MREIPEILFVCGTNSCRSQMAEGLLRARGGDRIVVTSAGTSAGGVHPLSVRAMAELDIDISAQESKALEDLPRRHFDLVITLCDAARGICMAPELLDATSRKRLFSGMPVSLHWSIDDPADAEGDDETKMTAFRASRDLIASQIDSLLNFGYLGALTTERRRLQVFADMLDEGVLIHDEHRHVFVANKALRKITDLGREDLDGRDCHTLFGPNGLCGEKCQFCNGGEAPSGRHEYSSTFVTGQGVKKYLRLTTELMELSPGRRGVVAVVRDESRLKKLQTEVRQRRAFHGMVGISAAAQEVFQTIESVGTSDYPVLVTGESGTGKELVAAAIHAESRRHAGPFVPVNCGALPENIVESELFGHVRGAFTGAIRDKKGRFELAKGGTLFLDEVGEIPPQIQVKLLRVLQEKRFERVGGEQSIASDVRIVSATNRDLRQMVADGTFREDLYYRLAVVPIYMPPLRERREDIPLLVQHILMRIRKESRKHIERIDDRAHDLILAHTWPGNIRELINALQFASVRCGGREISPEHLPPELRDTSPLTATAATAAMTAPPPPPAHGRTKLTNEAVDRALAAAGGNKAKAAKMLGVGRATLYRFFDRQKN